MTVQLAVSSETVGALVLLGFVVGGLLAVWQPITRLRQRRRRFGAAAREAQLAGRLAAAEAADPLFDLDRLRDDVRWLVVAVEDAWNTRDEVRLDALLGPDLREEWRAARASPEDYFKLDGQPECHVVDIVDDDQAVVHVAMRVLARQAGTDRYGYVGGRGDENYDLVGELWTLGRRDDGWILLAIERDDAAPTVDVHATVTSPVRWWRKRTRSARVALAVTYLVAAAALVHPLVGPWALDQFDGDSYVREVEKWGLLGGAAIPLLWVIVMIVLSVHDWRRRARHRARERAGAAVAAAEDPMFDPELIVERAIALARDVVRARARRDAEALRPLVGPRLLAAWARRFETLARRDDDGEPGDRFKKGGPKAELVRVINRHDDRRDRAIVRVRGSLSRFVYLDEYWTLGKRDGEWILLGVELAREGDHHEETPWVLTPEDDPELADAARAELAAGDAVDAEALRGLVSTEFADDARAAALDLALVDDRFSPDVLAIVARSAVAAWVEALDGTEERLEAMAEPAAVQALLHGTDTARRTRRVVRGPRIEALRIETLDDGIVPPIMRLLVEIRAIRYREDLDTGLVVDGSTREPQRWTERWTFALDADANVTWRLVEAEPVSAAAGSGRPRS